MEFSDPNDIKASFENEGGEFISPLSVFNEKLPEIKAFVFDWDGVFNSGFKQDTTGSPFSEPSSMGLNMIRFSNYLKTGSIPPIFIITGENNITALKLAQRECFNAVYLNVKNKLSALEHIEKEFNMLPNQLAFIFDDILDLGIASKVGLRFAIKRKANPLLKEFMVKNKLADYCTATEGNEHAVREVCELVIGLNGNYESTISNRLNFSEAYTDYLEKKNKLEPIFYNGKSGTLETYVQT